MKDRAVPRALIGKKYDFTARGGQPACLDKPPLLALTDRPVFLCL